MSGGSADPPLRSRDARSVGSRSEMSMQVRCAPPQVAGLVLPGRERWYFRPERVRRESGGTGATAGQEPVRTGSRSARADARGVSFGLSPRTTGRPVARHAGTPLATHDTSRKPPERRIDAATLARRPDAQIVAIGRSS